MPRERIQYRRRRIDGSHEVITREQAAECAGHGDFMRREYDLETKRLLVTVIPREQVFKTELSARASDHAKS